MGSNSDTIFALATPKIKSALAVFRITGTKSFKTIKNITKIKKYKTKPSLTSVVDKDKNIVDQVVITFFKSPKSYTGEDLVEISCHGSIAVINKITEVFLNNEIRLAEPGEFTRRALLNNKISVLQAESLNDLINSETENQRKTAINNLSGGLEKYLAKVLKKISKLLADVEAVIDFSEEDLPKKILHKIEEQKKNILYDLTKKVKESKISNQINGGFRITILGRPNTGKSSFINYISNKDISIVTNIPGTTTDLVSSNLEIDGNKYLFIDSAGIRKHRNNIEKIGIKKTLESAEISDLNLIFLEKKEKKQYKNIKNKIFIKSKYDIKKTKIKDVNNISSVDGYGIKKILKKIQKKLAKNNIQEDIFSRERHINSIENSIKILKNINFKRIDMASEDLRLCYNHLKQINQIFDIEEILDIIFSDFCIGK